MNRMSPSPFPNSTTTSTMNIPRGIYSAQRPDDTITILDTQRLMFMNRNFKYTVSRTTSVIIIMVQQPINRLGDRLTYNPVNRTITRMNGRLPVIYTYRGELPVQMSPSPQGTVLSPASNQTTGIPRGSYISISSTGVSRINIQDQMNGVLSFGSTTATRFTYNVFPGVVPGTLKLVTSVQNDPRFSQLTYNPSQQTLTDVFGIVFRIST